MKNKRVSLIGIYKGLNSKSTSLILESMDSEFDDIISAVGDVQLFNMRKPIESIGYKVSYGQTSNGYYITAKKRGRRDIIITTQKIATKGPGDVEFGNANQYIIGRMDENKSVTNDVRLDEGVSSTKSFFTEQMNRLNNVTHNNRNIINEVYGGYGTFETESVINRFKADKYLVKSTMLFMESYNGNHPYRDFIQQSGLSSTRNIDGVNWVHENLKYAHLNEMMTDVVNVRE